MYCGQIYLNLHFFVCIVFSICTEVSLFNFVPLRWAQFSLCCTRRLFHRSYPTTSVRTSSLPVTLNCADHLSRTLRRNQERFPDLHHLHPFTSGVVGAPQMISQPVSACKSDIKDRMTKNKFQQDEDNTNNAVQFIKTQASTCTSLHLPSHHVLLRLSQESWFLPREGFPCERARPFHLQNCFPGNATH